MDLADLPILLLTLVGAGLQMVAMLAVFIAAVAKWDHTRVHLRRALVFAVILLALDLPNRLVGAWFTDMSAVLPFGGPSGDDARIGNVIGVLPGLLIALALYGAMVPVTLRAGGRWHAFPWLYGKERSWGVLGLAAVGGVALGLGSTVLFHQLGIGMGSLMDLASQMTPDLDRSAAWFNWGVVLPAVCAAAIGEELLFRGAVQRWLTSWSSRPWLSIALTSLFWALLHAPNTDAPLLKLGQIFVIGLMFGALANRHGVESTIVAHVGLNIGATVLELGVYG